MSETVSWIWFNFDNSDWNIFFSTELRLNKFFISRLKHFSDCALNQQLGWWTLAIFSQPNVYLWPNISGDEKILFKIACILPPARRFFRVGSHWNQMVSLHSSVFLPLPRNMGKWYCLIYLFKKNCLHFSQPRDGEIYARKMFLASFHAVSRRIFMFNWTVTAPGAWISLHSKVI